MFYFCIIPLALIILLGIIGTAVRCCLIKKVADSHNRTFVVGTHGGGYPPHGQGYSTQPVAPPAYSSHGLPDVPPPPYPGSGRSSSDSNSSVSSSDDEGKSGQPRIVRLADPAYPPPPTEAVYPPAVPGNVYPSAAPMSAVPPSGFTAHGASLNTTHGASHGGSTHRITNQRAGPANVLETVSGSIME